MPGAMYSLSSAMRAGPASLCGEGPSGTLYLDGTVIKSCLARGSKLARNLLRDIRIPVGKEMKV